MTPETIRTWLAAKQVASRYEVGIATVWRWARDRQDFPKPKRLGDNCTRWRLADLEQWENEREVA
ncbi:helix-turn-helix transcriptional regulator [Halomonas sp. GXIMD04776]|uniref:helix-turn-helix transcriptional regulator n=1 Tax=Halomonas sp. GXIMD04776 TaxID=3415605 RepID=UPI003C8D143A